MNPSAIHQSEDIGLELYRPRVALMCPLRPANFVVRHPTVVPVNRRFWKLAKASNVYLEGHIIVFALTETAGRGHSFIHRDVGIRNKTDEQAGSSTFIARPKSVIFTVPERVSRMFSGLMSR